MSLVVLSHIQVEPLLTARRAGQATAVTSTDLGLTSAELQLQADGVTFPDGERLTWAALEAIAAEPNACFHIEHHAAHRIQVFSELMGRHYSLYPTQRAPTMLVGGFPMHRIKDTDPWQDTLAKIKAAGPLCGHVLDTCTGLGYTAIEAAKTASVVVTIELDPAAQAVARLNPWSQALFTSANIQQLIGDSAELIETFAAQTFTCLIHDPPTLSLGGELYSLAFYRQAHRVLKPNGRMFHYLGNPESKSGASVTRGVLRRLKEAGFTRVSLRPEAFGAVAYKAP